MFLMFLMFFGGGEGGGREREYEMRRKKIIDTIMNTRSKRYVRGGGRPAEEEIDEDAREKN